MSLDNPGPRGHETMVNVAQSDIIDIETIEQFAAYVARWHQLKLKSLEHMLAIPEGSEATLNINGTETTVKLEGAALEGFKAGVQLAMIDIGNLPFVSSVEGEDETPAANDDTATQGD